MVEIPKTLKIIALRPRTILRVLTLVDKGLGVDTGRPAIVDALRLRDGVEVRIITKQVDSTIYWLVQDWIGRSSWAGGMFSVGSMEHTEEVAVALPAMRGRGLYIAVLKHLRKTYKRALLSDRSLSEANILTWVRAGASVGADRFRINPHKAWIKDFVAVETVTL